MPARHEALIAIDSAGLHAALGVAEQWLEANRDAINAINVYPVPDGDTGTNMLLTLRAARRAVEEAVPSNVDAYAAALSRGALLGARGNSGVILSQMMRGLAEGLEGASQLGATELRRALQRAAACAYESVGEPVEGTMLTVMREAAEATARGQGTNLETVATTAAREAAVSVTRTPELLPALRQAGVVDAGGEGVAVLLAGLGYAIRGEPLPEAPTAPEAAVRLTGVEHEGHGYCVQYVVTVAAGDTSLDRSQMVAALEAAGGESVLAVGDPDAVRVHLHAEDPGPALSIGAAAGPLTAVSVENMQAQHDAWARDHQLSSGDTSPGGPSGEAPSIGLLAVVEGDGWEAAFRELGASVLRADAAKPSAGELLEAARRAGTEHTFILPNDPNVRRSAEVAAAEDPARATVIPSRSAPAGLAAAVAFLPDNRSNEHLAEDLREAVTGIQTIAVARSVRDAVVDGVAVSTGDAMAMLDGRLVARTDSLEHALLEGLALALDMRDEAAELATVYLGSDAPIDAEARLREQIRAAHRDLDVEFVRGGQPHYAYLVGVE